MFAPSKTVRALMGTAAVALAFGPLATPANALDLNDPSAALLYRGTFASSLVKATGDNAANTRAGGFMVELEAALKAPADKTRVVDYPPRAAIEALRITAVVPPKGLESQPIPVCAEQNNKVLGTWNITNDGHVVPVTGSWATTTTTNTACKEFILGQRSAINHLAQERANGTPAASTQQQGPANPSSPAN